MKMALEGVDCTGSGQGPVGGISNEPAGAPNLWLLVPEKDLLYGIPLRS